MNSTNLCNTIVHVDNFIFNKYNVATCGKNEHPDLSGTHCCGTHSSCAKCDMTGCQHKEHSTFLPYTGDQILCKNCISLK